MNDIKGKNDNEKKKKTIIEEKAIKTDRSKYISSQYNISKLKRGEVIRLINIKYKILIAQMA